MVMTDLNPGNLMLWWKVLNDQATATQKWCFPFIMLLTRFHLISWDKLCTLFYHRISEVFRLFLGSMQQSNQFHELWWDHSLGFLRSSWEIFNKKAWFDFTGGFCHIWRHTLQHYSSTFLCHADFIPDRSCLDVPVGRKCSACNGLAPEFLYERDISLKYSSPLPLNYSKTLRNQAMWATDAQEIPIRYSLFLMVCT